MYRDRSGHPVLLDGALIPEVLGMDPRWGLAAILRRHESSVDEVAVDDPGVVRRRR